MGTLKSFESVLYSVNDHSFTDIAITLFRHQASHNPIYRQYIQNLSVVVENVQLLEEIPFLPISFFKRHMIKTANWEAEVEFNSSGTTGTSTSRHFIKELDFYLTHAEKCFSHFFGALQDYNFIALLPSYQQQSNSSLIAMIDSFIAKSKSPWSGYYLNDLDKLSTDLENLKHDSRKTILWGVSFALLDLVENRSPDLSHCILFETGGMKGRRKEITRQELHQTLRRGLRVNEVFSEYGMTELLSQAYSMGENFKCSPWMKVIGRELTDPFHKGLTGETAGLNVIDLANWHSIAFIETEDIGKVYCDGSFEVLGRMDNSDIRGCNLLVE